MSILFAILLFSLLIFVHELGHFVAAKLSNVQVNEFSMFMGPAIFQKKKGETLYTLRCIPIGGYCAMEGEDGESDNPRSFQKAAWWKRLIILVAGSFMNFVVGVVIVAVVLFCRDGYVAPELSSVESWSTLASENGLQPGDTILEIDGKKIRVYEDFSLNTMLLEDGNYDIKVLRDGQELLLPDVPMIRQPVLQEDGSTDMLYGISFTMKENDASVVPGQIWPTAMNNVRMVTISLKMLLTGQASMQDVGGPVLIVQMMSQSADAAESTGDAILALLNFAGFLAINLAVMNMLPIPALDGGRVVGLLLTTGIEKVIGRKIDPKYEGYIHGVGMILLLILMGIILFKDIFTIIG